MSINTLDVHDGFKEWRADGEMWERSNRGERPSREARGPKMYEQRGPGKGLSDEELETISQLVAERSECKAVANYNRADEIFDTLQNQYNVNVDDKRSEWALLNEEYLLNTDETSFVPSEEIQAKIGELLGQRVLARKARDFNAADDIRDELRDDYVVEIDDRSKDYVIVAPEGAEWSDDDDNDEEGGDINIVSKQEWDEEDDDDDEDDEDDEVDDDDEVEDASSSVLDETVLSSMTVPELKEKLRESSLPVSGRKSELIERLINNA